MRLTLIHPAIGHRPGESYIRSWQMEPLPIATLRAYRLLSRPRSMPGCSNTSVNWRLPRRLRRARWSWFLICMSVVCA